MEIEFLYQNHALKKNNSSCDIFILSFFPLCPLFHGFLSLQRDFPAPAVVIAFVEDRFFVELDIFLGAFDERDNFPTKCDGGHRKIYFHIVFLLEETICF
jgi:hypothetical protein